jgi:hypothetical protein
LASGGGGRGTPPLQPAAENFAGVRSLRLAHKLPRGGTPPSLRIAAALLSASFVMLSVGIGCGGGEGAAAGATVSVYTAASLCSEAESELARDGGEAGDVHVRVVCLPSAESSQKLDLAQIGANARRATEDSSSIGYIGEPTKAASRFSEPILEEAGIAQLPQISGTAAMKKLLQAVDEAGSSSSLRESVRDALE